MSLRKKAVHAGDHRLV